MVNLSADYTLRQISRAITVFRAVNCHERIGTLQRLSSRPELATQPA
jgi:hypothetical protein